MLFSARIADLYDDAFVFEGDGWCKKKTLNEKHFTLQGVPKVEDETVGQNRKPGSS